MSLVLVLKNKQVISDPYADPYGDSTGWTRQFRMEYDLRVFREKGKKALQSQRKIPLSAAHNPEVVGSSPASATIKSPGSVRFQDFFLRFMERKVRSKILRIRRKSFDPYSDP